MSHPQGRRGRHAAQRGHNPGAETVRRIGAAAAALTAGVLPLAAAGSASAAAVPQDDLSALRLPSLALPAGLPDSVTPAIAAVPLSTNTPFDGTADALVGGVISQADPAAAQLRRSGLPTVGDLTGTLSGTQVPGVGTVGSVTQKLPVTTVLGAESPVTGTLRSIGGL